MTTLASDKPREFDIQNALSFTIERAAPVVATDIIYNGAAVGRDSSGNAGPLTVTGGGLQFFLGFAYTRADNAAGAAGAVRVDLAKRGFVKLPVVNVDSADDVGKFVLATDDDTFTASTLTSGQTGGLVANAVIGKVHAYIGADGFRDHGSTTCWVYFEGHDLMPAGATLLSTA